MSKQKEILYKQVNGVKVRLSAAEIALREESERLAKLEMAEMDKVRYKAKRQLEYPPVGEQLDAILKHLNYMQLNGETTLVTELDGIIGKWLQVKTDNPKPEGDK